MIDSIKQFAVSFEFISFLALITYWVPLFICLVVYVVRWIAFYRVDLKNCSDKFYTPQLTVGVIIIELFLAIAPCINLFALVFDCAISLFNWIGRTFDMPLVRHRYHGEPPAP